MDRYERFTANIEAAGLLLRALNYIASKDEKAKLILLNAIHRCLDSRPWWKRVLRIQQPLQYPISFTR